MYETLKSNFILNSKGEYLKAGEELKVSNHASHKDKRFGFVPIIVENVYNANGERKECNAYVTWIDENLFE